MLLYQKADKLSRSMQLERYLFKVLKSVHMPRYHPFFGYYDRMWYLVLFACRLCECMLSSTLNHLGCFEIWGIFK